MDTGQPASAHVDLDLLEAVASRLDLREPNRDALHLTAYRLAEHYGADGRTDPFEGVCDVATGVGKTYIVAGAIEYFAALGTRNFAVIAPGKTIQRKTELQFTRGTPKSLLGGMEVEPVVITSENFTTAAVAATLDDPSQVKLFVFTVQSLLRPERSEVGRRTHKFQEGLGEAFYDHLDSLDDLIVFADEHHCYYGDAFSNAVRGLTPYALVGLTATPHKKTPKEAIYFRYPLAAAIADELVKSPVIVGRSDDRRDTQTKLLDATRLLDLKEQALARNAAALGGRTVNPVMLVVAKTIDDADEVGRVLREPGFAGGRYVADDPERDPVLVVHSSAPDEALAQLESVEDPASPIRVIVSVGMLKEGWDVKNVYVIVSLRSSVSEILTEQTLGRGLRLPFGRHTGIEILDTLEVVAHERYEELLRRSGAKLSEEFVDLQTHLATRRNAEGEPVLVVTETEVEVGLGESASGTAAEGAVSVTELGARAESAAEEVAAQVPLRPRDDLPALVLPRVKTTRVSADFSLADIVVDPHGNVFRSLGERLAVDPEDALRRTRIGARIVTGPDGLRRTVATTSTVADTVESAGVQLSLEGARKELEDRILSASIVPPRKGERAKLQPLLDQFFAGLEAKAGDGAGDVLSAYLDRSAQGLIDLITDESRAIASRVRVDQVVAPEVFAPERVGRPETSNDLDGAFARGVGYVGWTRSVYDQAWFDSAPERAVAAMLDRSESVAFWVRLLRHDLEIAWDGGRYNPDLVCVGVDDVHWLIEVKSDKSAKDSAEVEQKRLAAQRWANHVNASPKLNGVTWRYLLAREQDISRAKGSWEALQGLGLA